MRRATTELYSSTLGRAKQRRRFVQIVATVDRHARLMYSHIELRSLSTNLRRAERPCGGCWGCSPQRCELDAASSRTLGSPTAMWSSCGSTKSRPCSTACARHRACGRKIRRCPTYSPLLTKWRKQLLYNTSSKSVFASPTPQAITYMPAARPLRAI